MSLLFRIAWRNLSRAWWRTTVAVAAIGFGLGAAVFLVGFYRGMIVQMIDTAVLTRLGHVAVHAEGYHGDPDVLRNLPDGGRAALATASGWAGVAGAPRLQGDGLIQSARRSVRGVVLGVDPDLEGSVSSVPASVVEGTFFDEEPAARARRSRLAPIVIGARMAERLRVSLGDKVVVHAPGETGLAAFRVRGIYRTASSEFDGAVAFLRLPDAQRLFGVGDRVTEVAFLLERPEEAAAVQAHLRAGLEGSGSEVLLWEEREPLLAAMVEGMGQIYWILYAAVFVAMAFGIANVQLMGVFERIREFGVVRSIGLRARGLVTMVLLESLLLTLAGTAAGLGLGLGTIALLWERGLDLAWFSEGLRAYGIGTVVRPSVSAQDVVQPLVIATITALVSGLAPALRAARLVPADALRHV
jgi:ABC-type lipoprotein release transport system permease subunit